MTTAPTPRKTARQARAKATRAAILEGAARILEDSDAADLTTNRIAERAGVSVGSLYQYFPNKEAILAEILRESRAALLRAVQEAEDLDGLIQAAVAHQFDRPRLALALEYLEPGLGLDAEARTLGERLAAAVLPVLRALSPGAGEAEARDAVAICKALVNAAALDGETGREVLLGRCRRGVLGYLGATAPATLTAE